MNAGRMRELQQPLVVGGTGLAGDRDVGGVVWEEEGRGEGRGQRSVGSASGQVMTMRDTVV